MNPRYYRHYYLVNDIEVHHETYLVPLFGEYVGKRENSESLEPLKDLPLNNLDCSGNQIATLEPFVDAKDPPQTFIFDCDTLADAEIEHAIAVWSKKGRNINVDYGQDLLAKRASKGRGSTRLGLKPGIPATENVLKVVVKDFGPRL